MRLEVGRLLGILRTRRASCTGRFLSLALEAWWRGEISQGKLLEVGRLLGIADETILDLAD